MRIFLMATLVVSSAAFASLKGDIEHDLRRLAEETKRVSDRCVQLERDIPRFNTENDARNATIAGKRAELALSDSQLALAIQIQTQLQAQVNGTIGEIAAKTAAKNALRGDFLADLRAQRVTLSNERTAKLAEKRVVERERDELERKLGDLDNFRNAAEVAAARARILELEGLFFTLKGRLDQLATMIAALDAQIRNPVIPALATLTAEIAALETRKAAELTELNAKNAQVTSLRTANSKIKADLAKLEKAAGAVTNFVIPAICNTL